MSTHARDRDDGAAGAATPRVLAPTDPHAERRLRATIDDFLLPDDARLDDRARAALTAAFDELVAGVASGLRRHAARLLAARDAADLATAMAQPHASLRERLVAADVFHDGGVMREVIARVQQDLVADALPAAAPERERDPDRASLLPRLAQSADPVVASGALALLAAENRHRLPVAGQPQPSDLPADLHHRLVWWVAAALREPFADATGAVPAVVDRALVEAAQRALAAHDEGERPEAAAMRLAAALDVQAEELPAVLTEALADRRLSLFIAVLGHALGLGYSHTRELVLDPAGDRLWLLLRALELDRSGIARIGLALSEADPRRDVDRFADALDGIAAVAPAAARHALAPLLLHPDYRTAIAALARP